MALKKISENTKKVLCGFGQFPDATDRSLAKKIAVNTSTISTIRQRLKETGLIRVKYLPNFFLLIKSAVVIATGKFRYPFPENMRENVSGLVIYPSIPFYIAADNLSWLSIGVLPLDRSPSEKTHPMTSTLNEQYIRDTTFEIEKKQYNAWNVKVWRNYDYSSLLCSAFNAEKLTRPTITPEAWSPDKLRKNDRKVLQSLLRNPDSSDYKRSQVLDLSHPTFSKIRKNLLSQGLLTTIIEPNMIDFGFSILAWFHIKLTNRAIDKSLLAPVCNYPNNFFCIQDQDSIFILACYETMNDLMQGQEKIISFLSKAMIPYENIVFNYFSLENPSFIQKLEPLKATLEIIGEPEEKQVDIVISDPTRELAILLREFLPEPSVGLIIDGLKQHLEIARFAKEPSKVLASMILELLTEPKYLLTLDDNKRTNLQTRLIQKLNSVRKAGLEAVEQLFPEGLKTGKKSIIIVQDSKSTIDVLTDLLETAGYHLVGVADNGQAAVDLYKKLCEEKSCPDVLLLDVFIKGMDGIEATRLIKKYDPSACIVILTSSLNRKIKAAMISIGVEEYLVKPVTRDQLLNGLERAIAAREE